MQPFNTVSNYFSTHSSEFVFYATLDLDAVHTLPIASRNDLHFHSTTHAVSVHSQNASC